MNTEKMSATPDNRPLSEQPRWRRDFPIDWLQDSYIARRDFTKFMVLTSFAFVIGQFWIVAKNYFRKKKGELPLQKITDIDEIAIAGATVFEYANAPRILVRLDENAFVAYEQQCTHLTCPVIPQTELGRLHCPCHEGYFDINTGNPTAGPPRRPLQRVKLEIRGNIVYAAGLEER
jgi:Rieske Fe-S protein